MRLRNWLQFIFSHSIFISFCATALCYQTYALLHTSADHYIYALIFFATLSSYNFYWLVSKYYFRKNLSLKIFLLRNFSNIFFFITALCGVCYSFFHVQGILPYIIIATILTVLYSVPLWPVKSFGFIRKAGFVKTLLLAFTWTYVTVIIPAREMILIQSLSLELLFVARFLFMLMLCIIFDSRDIEVDKIHSLRSLATDVSPVILRKIMIFVFSLYIICGFLLRYFFSGNSQVISFFITGLLTLFVYQMSLRKQGYLFYYFLVDGLMLFSSLGTFLATI